VALFVLAATLAQTATTQTAAALSVEAVGKGQRLFSALNRSIIKLKIAPILKIQSTYRGKQT
jgi:hypothetical protein